MDQLATLNEWAEHEMTGGRSPTNQRSFPFIHEISFPHFKNLAANSNINFAHAITALVGPNGTNKSSILRALQACPEDHNIGDYWFDTPLDSISMSARRRKNPQRYIHRYRLDKETVAEVIKTRVMNESRGPDYFETSAPRVRDGMAKMPSLETCDHGCAVGTKEECPGKTPCHASRRSKTRWNPIRKSVLYLDFRQELPAYDILMSFNWRHLPKTNAAKKKRVRKGSKHVKSALDNLLSEQHFYGKQRILEGGEELSTSELQAVSKILGKEYKRIRLVKHDYFEAEGYTATLETNHQMYSEAFAGSGEFAVIMLVRGISRAPLASLILLDEPETSLHPGAQRELMRFIAHHCVTRQHQVVLATHSPTMVEDLPDCSRKLLNIRQADGRIEVASQTATIAQAFSRLGGTFSKNSIIVEDELARESVLASARSLGQDFLETLDVKFIPGGAQSIIANQVLSSALINSQCTFLFDGDQRPAEPISPPDLLNDKEVEEELKNLGIKKKNFPHNSGPQSNTYQANARIVLEWICKNVEFMPGDGNPEQRLLMLEGNNECGPKEAKNEWVTRAREHYGQLPAESPTAADILSVQRAALAEHQDPELRALIQTIQSRMKP